MGDGTMGDRATGRRHLLFLFFVLFIFSKVRFHALRAPVCLLLLLLFFNKPLVWNDSENR